MRRHLIAALAAESVDELWQMHCGRMAEFGFDRLVYGFTQLHAPGSLGSPRDLVVLSNHPAAYVKRFIHEGLFREAPLMDWALNNEGARSWAVTHALAEAGKLSPAQRRVYEFNRDSGVTAGYTISFRPISTRAKGAIALTARAGLSQDDVEAIWAEHGEDIVLMNNVAHLKIMVLPHPVQRQLKRRQREALEWVGAGKTTADIATIMGLKVATVEKHLRNARDALEAETTAQAVARAAFHNQMFVLEANALRRGAGVRNP